MPFPRSAGLFAGCFFLAATWVPGALAELTPKQKADAMESFEIVWRTVRDRHPDPALHGLDWVAIHRSTRPLVARAASMDEVRAVLNAMLAQLSASHYAIIPGSRYIVAPAPVSGAPSAGSPAAHDTLPSPEPDLSARPGPGSEIRTKPEGKLVTFGNLPEQRVIFESRLLPSGAGYIHFNEFLDPVSLMPQFAAAIKQFMQAPGVVLDLRGNPGGIGAMAMGIAGFFIGKTGQQLGEMRMREITLKFVVFPRPEIYPGKLAILVDAGSASTTEILAQGLQDLQRARIFGTLTAGAALPSDIIRLPDGDGFQYAQASYTSVKGRVLEGNGVTPDEVVTGDALEAAEAWIALPPVPVR